KTSIGKSIAKALGRKYARISLGGVRDEAEIRGHRKTYVGAMPGRIIDALRTAKTINPVILLDEIDKMSSDYKGDPSSAMLEVLDSEQNNAFVDHYVEVPVDLSEVLFITTANNLDTIPAPLRDRMEVIELSSYTREEKFNIAKKHLIPKQLKKNGESRKSLKISDSAIYSVIDFYTREAGVRKLERRISEICRKSAKMIVSGEKTVNVTEKNIEEFLGIKKYHPEKLSALDEVGLVNGLAWTSVGGTMLPLEVLVLDGTGKTEFTGSLGEVMKESAKIAVSLTRSLADKYGIDKDFYKNKDIHIHAPEGAVPKDGPSAGVTLTTALVSALSGTPVRRDVAMTGEITLRGKVLAIGGLKEKTMAAYRAGIMTVCIPKDNVPDIEEIDEKVKESIRFVPAEDISTVLETALVLPNCSLKEKQEREVSEKSMVRKSVMKKKPVLNA
ncbi:MAG: endopeptidase La, partial [Oscillospiraceae bacterium]|nr:endopeptidase La [Oscillospiraceae bacterium]